MLLGATADEVLCWHMCFQQNFSRLLHAKEAALQYCTRFFHCLHKSPSVHFNLIKADKESVFN